MTHDAQLQRRDRSDGPALLARCSCGSWLEARGASDGLRVASWAFNRLCPATELCYARLGGRSFPFLTDADRPR